MLRTYYRKNCLEAGCDEAGRGCLAGPVFAAAVILPPDYKNSLLNDSKQLSIKQRCRLRTQIEKEAISWSVASVNNTEIDEINILNASILAMHKAIAQLKFTPDLLLIDGNRFHAYGNTEHICIVKGDARYLSIAAASVLAKTHRDEFMEQLHIKYPVYGWITNKGYPTPFHRRAVREYGLSPYHRKSFNYNEQLKLRF